MVEGPGCKLKGETLKKRVCGQTVKNVESCESPASKSYEAIKTYAIKDVKTLGKELYIIFSGTDACLRLHFLMNGSICFNESSKSKQGPSIILVLSRDVVSIHDSCVDVRSSVECLARYTALCKVDICAEVFDYSLATELVSQHEEKMICDVIMDQDVLPGVGNIIKNEGLFNSGIDPTWLVKELKSNQLSTLLHRLRDFSAIFYKCRKEGTPLARYYKVYGKEECMQCKGKITVCKPGSLKRLTYYCPTCQGCQKRLPGTACGSLLGFVRQSTENSDDSEMWQCSACTLLNNSQRTTCLACLTSRTKCSLLEDCNYPNNKQTLKRALPADDGYPAKRHQNRDPGGLSATRPCQEVLNSQQCVPLCNSHQCRCVQKRVTKPGPNNGRPFYICALPKPKQCNFFKWGDDNFPRCCHNKVTIQRSVLKQNENNGRKFFCCSLNKKEQCNFFQWAE